MLKILHVYFFFVEIKVDVIFRARGEMLQKQLAYCYRLLGALETSQKWTEQLEKYPCELAVSSNGDIEA